MYFLDRETSLPVMRPVMKSQPLIPVYAPTPVHAYLRARYRLHRTRPIELRSVQAESFRYSVTGTSTGFWMSMICWSPFVTAPNPSLRSSVLADGDAFASSTASRFHLNALHLETRTLFDACIRFPRTHNGPARRRLRAPLSRPIHQSRSGMRQHRGLLGISAARPRLQATARAAKRMNGKQREDAVGIFSA